MHVTTKEKTQTLTVHSNTNETTKCQKYNNHFEWKFFLDQNNKMQSAKIKKKSENEYKKQAKLGKKTVTEKSIQFCIDKLN